MRTQEAAGDTVTVRPASGRDLPTVIGLLQAAGLPTSGVPAALSDFLVAEDVDQRVVGAVGLEIYGDAALLRSAVVSSDWHGRGLGRALVERLLTGARSRGIGTVYLLTTTAEHYFPRFGFERITSEEVPENVRGSVEFQGACPNSAIVMRATLV